MPVDQWVLAPGPFRCWRYKCVIRKGDPMRVLRSLNEPICAPCAKELLSEDQPPGLPVMAFSDLLPKGTPP